MRDKSLFIIGGTSGIGRGLVEHFAVAGAIVALCDVDEVQGDLFNTKCLYICAI